MEEIRCLTSFGRQSSCENGVRMTKLYWTLNTLHTDIPIDREKNGSCLLILVIFRTQF